MDLKDPDNLNFYLVMKGELLLEYRERKKGEECLSSNDENSRSAIFINEGAFVDNTGLKIMDSQIRYFSCLASKEVSLVVLTREALILLFDSWEPFGLKIKHHSRKIENSRLNFLREKI